ncbi:MAG: TolC family protein [Candidatus Aminicenantes bacterium]
MIKKFCVLFLVHVVLLSGIYGNETKNQPLSLEQCINTAIKNNPLVLSSYQQYTASLARINQAKAIPQPSIDWDSDLQPSFFDFKNTGEWYFGISESIEFPGKRSLRGQIAAKESDQIYEEIELLKLDITFLVKEAFYALLLAQKKYQYIKQNLELSNDFYEKTKLKFDAGDVARVEVLRASVEASKAASELTRTSNEVRLAKARLNYLMARKKYAPLEIKGEFIKEPLSIGLETLKKQALSFRPEIKSIEHAIEGQNLQKKQAFMSYLPDFDLGVNRHKVKGEGEWWDVTLSFPIPLFFWQPAKGEIAEAQANVNSLNSEFEHLKNTISLEVEESYMNAEFASSQIKLFEEEILTQAEEAYNMFLFSYQEGEIGGIELIEARRTLIQAMTSYADALYNYEVALASLEKSIGQRLKGENQ